jgi:hypothetical protein
MPSKVSTSSPLSSEKGVVATTSSPSRQQQQQHQLQPPPPMPRYPGGLRDWRRVQLTLQLPLAYRDEDDIKFTLRLLRSLPFFSSLLDHDLLTLAETMSVVEVAEAGRLLLRKRAAPTSSSTVAARQDLAAGSTVTSQVNPLTPSAFTAAAPSSLPSDDDDDGAGLARPSWMIPAAELFQRFRAQMAQGDEPSLPGTGLGSYTGAAAPTQAASFGGRDSRGKSSTQLASTNERPSSLGGNAGDSGSVELDQSKTPLFQVPKGWQDDNDDDDDDEHDGEEPFVLVLLSGHCELRWPRQRGPAEAPNTPGYYNYSIQPGDAMGYALIWAALPAGAQYVTTDTCTLLKVDVNGQPHDVKERLHRACRRANEVVYKAQRRFLAEKLSSPLFINAPAREGGGAVEGVAADNHTPHPGDQKYMENTTSSQQHSPTARSGSSTLTGTTALDSLLDLAARQLIPIRVPSEALLLREGLTPATECALYFVVEGSCLVVRRLWSQDQRRLEALKAHLLKELAPPNGVKPVLSSMPSTTSMEVAQLRPGDYCGDVAYLRVDPDNATSIDAEWTAAYWQNTFIAPASAGTAPDADESPLASSLRANRQNLPHVGETGAAGTAREGSNESKSLFRRHKATVLTQRSTQLFVLLPAAAAQVVRGTVLERMREHARACPSYATLLTEHEKLYKWALYKEKVLWEQSKKAPGPFR